MRITLGGKIWELRFVPYLGPNKRGDCDPPTTKGKAIRICTGQTDQEEMDTIIHECIHAEGWHIDEVFIERAATDIARVLLRLGYRRNKGE